MKLACVNVNSPNPKRLADFYKKALGAETNEEHGGPSRIEISVGTGDVCLVVCYDEKFFAETSAVCRGFEFHVDDVDKEFERISGLGVEINEMPQDLPWGYRFFNFKDPDGNDVDIVSKL